MARKKQRSALGEVLSLFRQRQVQLEVRVADLGDGTRAEGRVVEEGEELRVEFTDCGPGIECSFEPPYFYTYVWIGD